MKKTLTNGIITNEKLIEKRAKKKRFENRQTKKIKQNIDDQDDQDVTGRKRMKKRWKNNIINPKSIQKNEEEK